MFYIIHYINYYIHSIKDSHKVLSHKHTQKHMNTNTWAHTHIINNSNKLFSSYFFKQRELPHKPFKGNKCISRYTATLNKPQIKTKKASHKPIISANPPS